MIEYQSGTSWDVYEAIGKYIDHTDEDMQIAIAKNILYTNMFYQFVYTDKSFSELHDIFANGYETIRNSTGYKFNGVLALLVMMLCFSQYPTHHTYFAKYTI